MQFVRFLQHPFVYAQKDDFISKSARGQTELTSVIPKQSLRAPPLRLRTIPSASSMPITTRLTDAYRH
jgi:hypothetical protein